MYYFITFFSFYHCLQLNVLFEGRECVFRSSSVLSWVLLADSGP